MDKDYKCTICGRLFIKPMPHKCIGNFRKHHLRKIFINIKEDKTMTKEQAIELINNSNNCYSLWDAEELLKDCKCINRQNYNSHRWYIMATDIYEVEDGYIGVRGVSELKTETANYSDCDEHCIAEEYEAVQTTAYIPKN